LCSYLLFSVNLNTFRSLYVRMPELHLSTQPSRVIHNATTEICAQTCVEEVNFDCKSFDLDNLHRTCLLFNTSYEEGTAYLQESSLVDHYRSKCFLCLLLIPYCQIKSGALLLFIVFHACVRACVSFMRQLGKCAQFGAGCKFAQSGKNVFEAAVVSLLSN
jgi:hypothetical protein